VSENVIEIELAEIEDRMAGYSADAQADIRWLAREVRKAYNLGLRNAGPPASAIYDAATGLLSGGAYGVRFAMARARATRYRKMFAVMAIDLPLDKGAAGETLSEREADEIVKQVASRLAGCARATDTLARIDREKFAMILEELALPEHAERVKQKVEAARAEPLQLDERAVRADVTVGLQFYPARNVEDPKLN
jgi:diguanylate cyclase (GGDEF)-like protein